MTQSSLPTKVAQVLDATPHTSAQTIRSVRGGGQAGDPDLIFAGMGSGIAILRPEDVAATQTEAEGQRPIAFGTYPDNLLDAQGMVRKIVLEENNDLWVATQRAGLRRFSRTGDTWAVPATGFQSFTFPANGPDDDEDVRTMCVWRTSTGNLRVLIGVGADGLQSGKLYLLDPEAASPLLDTIDNPAVLPGEVWAMDALEGLAFESGTQDPLVTVLFGTACSGLVRMDLALDAVTIPDPSTWQTVGSGAGGLGFVRDILIDPDVNRQRAFVACHSLGVSVVSLTAGGLSVSQGPDELNPVEVTYALALSYDSTHEWLAVASGPEFSGETQFGAASRIQQPCTGPGEQASSDGVGVYVYDASAVALSQLFQARGNPVVWKDDKVPVVSGVGLRGGSASLMRIDLAAGTGIHVLSAKLNQGEWEIGELSGSEYGHKDGMMLVSTNEVFTQEDTLYTSTEFGLAACDRSGSNPPDMSPPASVIKGSPINVLAGFPEPNARVFTSGFVGVRFADVSGPNRLNPVLSTSILPKVGRGYGIATTTGLDWTVPGGTLARWIGLANTRDPSATPSDSTGSVQLIRVDDATEPDDAAKVREVARWLHRGRDENGDLLPNARLFRLAIRKLSNTKQAWYVSFGSNPATPPYPEERGSGLVVLEVKASLLQGSTQIRYEIKYRSRIRLVDPLPSEPEIEDPNHVTYDEARQRIYVALGTAGFASLDASQDPFAPSFDPLKDVRNFNPYPIPPNPGNTIETLYQAIAGPGDSVLVSGASSGIFRVDDYRDVANSPATYYRTRFQPLGLATDPSDASRQTVFVADAKAGSLRVQIPTP